MAIGPCDARLEGASTLDDVELDKSPEPVNDLEAGSSSSKGKGLVGAPLPAGGNRFDVELAVPWEAAAAGAFFFGVRVIFFFKVCQGYLVLNGWTSHGGLR